MDNFALENAAKTNTLKAKYLFSWCCLYFLEKNFFQDDMKLVLEPQLCKVCKLIIIIFDCQSQRVHITLGKSKYILFSKLIFFLDKSCQSLVTIHQTWWPGLNNPIWPNLGKNHKDKDISCLWIQIFAHYICTDCGKIGNKMIRNNILHCFFSSENFINVIFLSSIIY